MGRIAQFIQKICRRRLEKSIVPSNGGIEIKTDRIISPAEQEVINKNLFIPPVGSIVRMGGFEYRIRKITVKDVVLRPI